MKSNQLKLGSLLSYVQMALGIVIGLSYTPVMLRLLGQSEYGLYNTVASTISMLSILNLGFNSSYIRYYAKYKAENDDESIYKLNGLFLLIFLIIGIIAFICGLFLSFNLDLVFDKGLTIAEYKTATVLMVLLTINLAVSFPMSVFSNIISANERFVFLKIIGMLKTVMSPLVTLPLLLMGYKSIAMVTVTILTTITADTIYCFYVIKVLKNKFIFRDFEKGLFKGLLIFTSFIAINLIVDQINTNMDKFLLGRYKGTVAVAIYSVGYSLYQYYVMFSTAISGVFSPRIHNIVNSTKENIAEQKKILTELFTKVGRIQFLLLSLICTGVIFFGRQFILIWAGQGYEQAYYVALLLIIPGSIPLIQNLGIEIQRAQNKHQFRSIAYIIMAVINFGLTIILCQRYGAPGAAIGTAVSYIVANGIIMNIYYHKRCNINIIVFWKSIISMMPGIALACVFGTVIMKYSNLESPIILVASMVAYIFIYSVCVWLLAMNAYEKTLVNTAFRKVWRKCK